MPAARHASRSAFIALAVIAMIGRSLELRIGAQRPRGGEAIHLGHLHVHEDSRVSARLRANHVDGFATVVGDIELDPEPRQQLGRHHLVGRVVLGEQGSHADELPIGRSVRCAARSPVPVRRPRCARASKNEDAVMGLWRKTFTPSSAQRASSSFPA